jgi:uncharacterized membrane protein YdjX (TVP38/TMEM64 family)
MKKSVLVVLLAGSLAMAWWTGLLSDLTRPEAIREQVAAAGAWGPVLFIAIAVALFGVFMLAPAIWAAGALWPLPEAFFYSFIAAVVASIGTYVLTRLLGRGWARDRIPPSIRRWEVRLESKPFATVMMLRFLLWANPLVDMLVAISAIPVRVYMVSTMVGLVPPTLFHVLLGVGGVEMIALLPWWGWVLLVCAPALAALAYLQMRSRRVATVVIDVAQADRGAAGIPD